MGQEPQEFSIRLLDRFFIVQPRQCKPPQNRLTVEPEKTMLLELGL